MIKVTVVYVKTKVVHVEGWEKEIRLRQMEFSPDFNVPDPLGRCFYDDVMVPIEEIRTGWHVPGDTGTGEYDPYNHRTLETSAKFFAYAPGYEKFVEEPFSAIRESRDAARSSARISDENTKSIVNAVNKATFLQRLKYLFTSKLDGVIA